jgi:cytochrome c
MKSLIPVISALVFLGCSNEATQSETAQVPVEKNVAAPSTEATTLPAEEASPPLSAPETQPAASTPSTTQPTSAASVDGSALYSQKCASCHGAKAEKVALNKSQVIAEFSESQVKEALKGYQAGTYGKEMKALMQGQAKALDDAQIDALAKYIANL